MQTQPKQRSLNSKLHDIGVNFRLVGWATFWLQIGLAIVSALILAFAITGQNFSDENTPGIGIGIFWAVCGVLVLFATIFLSFRYTRTAKLLLSTDQHNPHKENVIKVLRLALGVSLVGMLLTILGGGATLGVLLGKVLAQPQGIAVYDPQKIVRALDILVAMANMTGIAAHFVGAIASLWLLERVNH
ncbi:MAG: DUF3611 family protein [Leptolyngbyaceae cyanobacterium RM1_406_9]|nr:DUF3611 family protein [Leptolyngbyaceae cyanobacterium RM1_406_9]